ncbi:nucleotidyltransferase domain-containing protein [Candidatus Parcubacteria bacterium]|nr:nucleotidyltransferase domain-containing protein [Candidatus Parcubacteria bacterium]
MSVEKPEIEKLHFDSNHSELELNPETTQKYARILEKEIGHGFTVDGIIEIGSYAKGEAVPGSDIDTRVYVSSPDYFIWQTSGSRHSDSKQKEAEQKFSDFLQTNQEKPRLTLDWFDFNNSIAKKICTQLGINVEFGLTDSRFAEYELNHLDTQPTAEHQLILESNPVYDSTGFLARKKSKMKERIYTPMVKFYQERYLESLPFEIYTHLQAHKMDKWKLEKSRQIQWVKWAVRSIRDAVGTKSYIQNGKLIYKKEDVLNFCYPSLPSENIKVIEELYRWKTDLTTREQMVDDFLANPDKYFALFKEYTKKLEDIVKRIKNL